ncbi:hypothetical protein TNCV_120191 [Trichonephila clavipes]|nr:hypothetical protein TNCV_120191 [Trichonephila clavipes]
MLMTNQASFLHAVWFASNAKWSNSSVRPIIVWIDMALVDVLSKIWMCLHAEIVEVEIEVVSPSIVPSGNFAELNRTVTCMVLKANDRRTSCPCHDEFRGPRSDYVRQVALENNNNFPLSKLPHDIHVMDIEPR